MIQLAKLYSYVLFFSSESVSNGHPDKVADIISDSILDNFLSIDPSSRVACESLVTTGQVIVAGEVESSANLDFEKIIRNTINEIGYDKSEYKFSGNSCEIKSYIHEQSTDISKGIIKPKKEDLGAGDQGIMFGYACNETTNYIPLSLDLSHRIMELLHQERILKKNIDCLRPDSKSQVTVKYLDNEKISSVDSIIISTQHDDFSLSSNNSLKKLRKDLKKFGFRFCEY